MILIIDRVWIRVFYELNNLLYFNCFLCEILKFLNYCEYFCIYIYIRYINRR